MKKLVLKKVVSILLSAILMLSMSSGVFAYHEEDVLDDVEIVPAERYINPNVAMLKGIVNGYNNIYITSSGSYNFNVNVTGGFATTAGMTIKTETNSEDSAAIVTVKRPSGSNIIYREVFSGNDEEQYQFHFAYPGDYEVEVGVYVPSGCYLRLNVWIY